MQNILYKPPASSRKPVEDSADDAFASDEYASPFARPQVKKRRELTENAEPQLRLLADGEKIDLEPLRMASGVLEDQIARLHNTLEQERREKQKLQSDYDELFAAVHHATQAQRAWEVLGRRSNAAGASLPGFTPSLIDQSAGSASFPLLSYPQFPAQFVLPQSRNIPAAPTFNLDSGKMSITPPQTADGSAPAINPETPDKDRKPKKTLNFFFNKVVNTAASPSKATQSTDKSSKELEGSEHLEGDSQTYVHSDDDEDE